LLEAGWEALIRSTGGPAGLKGGRKKKCSLNTGHGKKTEKKKYEKTDIGRSSVKKKRLRNGRGEKGMQVATGTSGKGGKTQLNKKKKRVPKRSSKHKDQSTKTNIGKVFGERESNDQREEVREGNISAKKKNGKLRGEEKGWFRERGRKKRKKPGSTVEKDKKRGLPRELDLGGDRGWDCISTESRRAGGRSRRV